VATSSLIGTARTPGGGDDDDGIGVGDDDNALPLNKQRYGWVIDYLETKYVRGMMINNCDETRAVQGCGKKMRRGREGGGKGEESGADNRDDSDREEEEGEGGEEVDKDKELEGAGFVIAVVFWCKCIQV
jgi:hypothetical protein